MGRGANKVNNSWSQGGGNNYYGGWSHGGNGGGGGANQVSGGSYDNGGGYVGAGRSQDRGRSNPIVNAVSKLVSKQVGNYKEQQAMVSLRGIFGGTAEPSTAPPASLLGGMPAGIVAHWHAIWWAWASH